MADRLKIDSNSTGLSFAEETSIGVLPGTPEWFPLEPNGYNDFGGNVSTVARNPISADRQRQKGALVGLDAAGGFNTDFTQANSQKILQGFMFADLRNKVEFGGSSEITGVVTATDDFEAASGLDVFAAGDIVFASGFAQATNNGRHLVTAAAAGALTVGTNLVDETPGATAKLVRAGVRAAGGDLGVDVSGSLPVITSSTLDFTTLGLIVGEYVFLGGDATAEKFSNAANNGFKRISAISANALTLDKSDATMISETTTTETVEIFFGRVLKNESSQSNIVRRSYNLERTLGQPDDASSDTQSEYIKGAVSNELTVNWNTADKVTMDMNFIGIDHETRDAATGVKSGNRNALVQSDIYNTSSDFARLNMAVVSDSDEAPTPLFAYVEEMTLGVNNNVSPNLAIGTLGAFDMTAGTFLVNGQMTVYFSNVAAIAAIRSNSDVTLDMAMVKSNAGVVIDIPLISLGEGRANIEQDQSIKLPISHDAASGSKNNANMDHTLLLNFFDYLPNAASA